MKAILVGIIIALIFPSWLVLPLVFIVYVIVMLNILIRLEKLEKGGEL